MAEYSKRMSQHSFNDNNVCKLPYNNNPNLVAVEARTRKIQTITAITLIKLNLKDEINRLQAIGIDVNIKDIRSEVNHIWNCLPLERQREFTTLANNANNINQNAALANEDSINRMIQIDIPQITNNPFEVSIFEGTKNFNDNDFESLILTSGSTFF